MKNTKEILREPDNVPTNFKKTSGKTSGKIVEFIQKNPKITIPELAKKIGKTPRAIEMAISKLKTKGILKRVGYAKGGYWEIIMKNAKY